LGAKTIELIHQNVHVDTVRDDLETLILDADLLEAVLSNPDPSKTKEIEIKLTRRLRRHMGNPKFKALSERLDALKERFEAGLLNSVEFLKQLLQLKSLLQEKSFQSASALEQEFFYWTNYFRSNPGRFFETIIREFGRQYPEVSKADIKSLEQDIKRSAFSLPIVFSDEGLLKMSRIHASDLVKRGGVISHTSSKGQTFSQRINEAGRYRCGAENVYIGSFDPLEALIALLIDSGVPDKGHRMNLLDPRFGKMGVSFQAASGKKGLLVQDFACP
jgi:hypothetical protein